MKAGDREKWQIEASSSLLAAAEAVGIAQIIRCEDYSELQGLLRVTALVLKFTNIMKSKLRKEVLTPNTSRINQPGHCISGNPLDQGNTEIAEQES